MTKSTAAKSITPCTQLLVSIVGMLKLGQLQQICHLSVGAAGGTGAALFTKSSGIASRGKNLDFKRLDKVQLFNFLFSLVFVDYVSSSRCENVCCLSRVCETL